MSNSEDQPDISSTEIDEPEPAGEGTILPPDYSGGDTPSKTGRPRRRSQKQIDLDKGELDIGFYERSQQLQIDFQEATLESQRLQNANLKLENIRFRMDLILRVIASGIIPIIVVYWLYKVLDVVAMQQSKRQDEGLSEITMVALLGTTTITVIGMMGIVARYLFTKPIAQTILSPKSPKQSIDY